MKSNEQVAGKLLECLLSWEPTACVVGNVTSLEVTRLLADSDVFTSCPACGSEPWCNIDCRVCGVMDSIVRTGER